MPTVHTHYVTWISRGRRHHGSAQQDITAPLNTITPDGGSYQAWASPEITWMESGHSHTADFAFWSITGAQDGASISTDQSPSIPVGGTDVVATAWYIEGGGDGPPGVEIDAFDVGLGDFVDDDFVSVVTDASLTANANEEGFVPTASAEDIRAYGSIHGVPFEDWEVFLGMEPTAGIDLNATQDSSAVAFAFYKLPVHSGHPKIPQEALGTWVSYGVKVDAGGPTGNGPVPPWNPEILRLAVGLMLAEAAGYSEGSIRSGTLKLAARQVTQAAAAIAKQMNASAAAGVGREVEALR
jgi:hypothetical protein